MTPFPLTPAPTPQTGRQSTLIPQACDAHPTLSALARTHLGGDVGALIRLLDALDTGTLRQARIERHHAVHLNWTGTP